MALCHLAPSKSHNLLSLGTLQNVDNCINNFIECHSIESTGFSFHQGTVGSEKLTWPCEADSLQRACFEITIGNLNGYRISIGIAGHLTKKSNHLAQQKQELLLGEVLT